EGEGEGEGSANNEPAPEYPSLAADCEVPIRIDFAPPATGVQWGSVEILTVTEDVSEGDADNGSDSEKQPAYYRDP
ncbi:MAG TPA: hypothetical protein DFR83_15060, partial [Deltaproteobacteria bacterium]|nr:hypothetical protein [Deltaproteobacteria bacterium]